MLTISDLNVRYDATGVVLRDLSLGVARGERVAVLGASGAGKTTLFRAIAGFVRPTSGAIEVDGVNVVVLKAHRLREFRSRVGIVPQGHDLVDPLAVYQNVMAGALGRWGALRALRFLCWPTSSELSEARSALRRVGLDHKLRAPTSSLSGGEHQRVAIARVLVQKPVLLLADEPVASLDPALSEQILQLICNLARESNLSLLCSLHNPDLAYRHFDRVVALRDGRIVAEHACDPGYKTPLTAHFATA